jgi:glutamyl-tRNA synthetase
MRGVRFAPSPTGLFHVGNLRTAWISHRIARALQEPWIVRFEDIDRERSLSEMQDRQLADLRALGLEPDQIQVQTHQHEFHQAQFRKAQADGRIYPCVCSRKEVAEALRASVSAPHQGEVVYSGACRELTAEQLSARAPRDGREIAWRFRVDQDPSGKLDFIVARAGLAGENFQPAYHWACALDDAAGAYRVIVRASDLQTAAEPQRLLQRWFAPQQTPPLILHTALVTQEDGHRLEKRTRGVTLQELRDKGISASILGQIFRKSWEPQEKEALRVLGKSLDFCEKPTQIRLSDLGL